MKETNLSKIVAAKVKFVELDLRRNISGFPFQPKMTLEMYRNMEKEMVDVFERMEGIYSGLYHSYYDIPVNVKRYLSVNSYIFYKEESKLLEKTTRSRIWRQP